MTRHRTDGESGKGGWEMSDIKTWHQRAMAHPDHQSGMISEGMIRARMCEEIDDLREALAIQQGCCDGAAAQDAHIRREREEHRAEVEKLRSEIERLREALRWYADPRNHFPVERRSPGAPDPAVIFVEEPPIMLDGGRRARSALEGKP